MEIGKCVNVSDIMEFEFFETHGTLGSRAESKTKDAIEFGFSFVC